MQNAAAKNLAGGTLYDALLAAYALQSASDRNDSWNTKHFERFGPDVAQRLAVPRTTYGVASAMPYSPKLSDAPSPQQLRTDSWSFTPGALADANNL